MKMLEMSYYYLESCPHCGTEAGFVRRSLETSHCSVKIGFQIRCKYCGATAPGADGVVELSMNQDGVIYISSDGREKAAENWNRRYIKN